MRPVALCWIVTTAAAAVLSAADAGPRPAAPRINVGGIVNAATNRPAPANFISPGAIISIYGAGLSKETHDVLPGDVVKGLLPETMGGVEVWFGRNEVPARLFYISPLQINAQAPAELRLGEWEVTVRFNAQESTEKCIVREYSPGLFQPARHPDDGTPVSQAAPARPGRYVLFFGTGFGPTLSTTVLTGQFAPPGPTWLAVPIEAQIGDILLGPEDKYYWGLAPGFAGLYQFNLRIPLAAPSGDLEVRIKVGEEWTQPGFRIAVQR